MTLDQMKAVIRPKVRTYLTASGAVTGVSTDLVKGADGTTKASVSVSTGTHKPSETSVEKLTDLLAEVIYAVLPALTVEVETTTTTGIEAKGSGTVR